MTLLFWGTILVGFLFSALFSGVETGCYTISRIRLRRRELERRSSAVVLSRLLRNRLVFVFTVLIGNNVAVYLLTKTVTDRYLAGGMASGELLLGFIPWSAEVAATLTLVFPLFIFAEVGPKNLFRKNADTLMYRLAGTMRLFVVLCYPLTWTLKQLFLFLSHGMDADSGRELHRLSSDGLKGYFSVGAKEGLISLDQSRMVENATSMHRVPVRTLMVPLKAAPSLPATATVADFKRLCARRASAQALLMDRHKVLGLVSLFGVVGRKLGDTQLLRPCVEDVLEIPGNRNLKSAFYRLRRTPCRSAVVVDARRHPIGFIRLEDIARYIAGSRDG